jgi:rod shape determining protein RodA
MLRLNDYSRSKLPFDPVLVGIVLTISFWGVASISSALRNDPKGAAFVYKQIVGIALGGICMGALAACDYAILLPRISKALTMVNIGALLIVLKLGTSSRGAQRWLALGPIQFQPSELAKIAAIVALAIYFTRRRDTIRDFKTVIGSLSVVGIPFALIFLQPDLGTGLAIITVWFGMGFVSGVRVRALATVALIGILGFSVLWKAGVVKDYQKARLTSFINPASDPHQTGYHLKQSQIAIGAGQLTGQGYKHGLQSGGQYIPEQHTDFIFTAVGEETGFIGSTALIGLYALLLLRCASVMKKTTEYFGRLIVAGVSSLLAFHALINIGMTIGLAPVTGVPLPFCSYGLSALIADMCCIGLVLSVARRSDDTLF